MPNSRFIVSLLDASGMNTCFERLLCDGPQTSEADLKCPEKKEEEMFPAGIEPATLPVWRARDNHYTMETPCRNPAVFAYTNIQVPSPETRLSSGPMAQWITRLTTDQKIAGSNPARIGNNLFLWYYKYYTLKKKRGMP